MKMHHPPIPNPAPCEEFTGGDSSTVSTMFPPGVFADVALAIPPEVFANLCDTVAAIEAVVASAPYRDAVLEQAPVSTHRDHGPKGAVLGYDFHLTDDGPRLIEINTNAGGMLLAQMRTQALFASGRISAETHLAGPGPQETIRDTADMFRAESALQRGDTPLKTVAIIDEDPHTQFLKPEFSLYADLLKDEGIDAVILDGRDLDFHDGRLWAGEQPIDLVYNRSCDFYLEHADHDALRLALDTGAAVITPHPRAHALFAAKCTLALLGDGERLKAWGIEDAKAERLTRCVPWTARLEDMSADEIWAQRRGLFFKPRCGHGSKAVYRGDKMTKRVWQAVQDGDYMVQTLVPPSMVRVPDGNEGRDMKLDVRLFTYDGRLLATTARLYRGQTTNFRTPGGGFAPLVLRSGASPLGEIATFQETRI